MQSWLRGILGYMFFATIIKRSYAITEENYIFLTAFFEALFKHLYTKSADYQQILDFVYKDIKLITI